MTLNLLYETARDFFSSCFDTQTSLSLHTGAYMCYKPNYTPKSFIDLKLIFSKPNFSVNFTFFLQPWDFLTANLFPAPESFFSACRHTTQHGNPNSQTVAWSIRMAFTEPNLNFTKRSLGSKFCSRKKTFQAFSSAKPLIFWFSEPNEVSAVSENFFISLVTLDFFLIAICNISVHFIPTATWSQIWTPRAAPSLSPPSCFSYSPFGPHQCNRQSHCFSKWVQMEERLHMLKEIRGRER